MGYKNRDYNLGLIHPGNRMVKFQEKRKVMLNLHKIPDVADKKK